MAHPMYGKYKPPKDSTHAKGLFCKADRIEKHLVAAQVLLDAGAPAGEASLHSWAARQSTVCNGVGP